MPANRDLIRRVNAMNAELSGLVDALRSGAAQRIDEARGGLRASRFDALARSGTHGDPTGSLALRTQDAATSHATELVNAVTAAQDALRRALSIVCLYPPPRVADAADRLALERINGREPCCQNCAQLTIANGQRRWEPIDASMREGTTVSGVLDEPMLLCQWCRKRAAAWGRLPNVEELARHHRGERVAWPTDVARPA